MAECALGPTSLAGPHAQRGFERAPLAEPALQCARMRGVIVVGCGLDSGEVLVAAAACAAARAAGEDGRLYLAATVGADAEAAATLAADVAGDSSATDHVLRTAASPVIAARHAGAELDPGALLERARESAGDGLLVAAVPGGVMAPLTERYAVRDLARELGLPVVLAARAAGGVTGQVRAAAEAARSAGLAVAAVVLTGWPEPPNRVQLDERALLQATARAEVLTLGEGAKSAAALEQAAGAWPVAAWAQIAATAAPPEEPAAVEAPAAPLVLDPYDAWTPRQVGDPRGTPRPQIMDAMLEIVAAEGPMTATRAYSLYNRAAGGRKLTSVAKAPLSSAVYWLAHEGKLALTREADIPWQGDDMVRLPDQPAVRVRELGSRTLDEVPLDEIAELVKLIKAQRGTADPTELKRAILNAYGLVRLTGRADEYLGLAIDLASS
jgi:dethiobiotin synthetase